MLHLQRKYTARQIFCTVVSVCLLPGLLLHARCAEPELASEAAILMEASTGRILYEKNADTLLYPASITKVLTGLVALQNGVLSDTVTVSAETVKAVPRSSSHIALTEGEQLSLEDALYATAISSANDAAQAVAEHIAGSNAAFCDLMNAKAREIGCKYTNFTNANGLPDENHFTTARDMALIAQESLKTPYFLTIYGAASHTVPATNKNDERNLVSKNKYVSGEVNCPGLLFSKTGWTSQSQGTLVTAVHRGGVALIAVTLRSPQTIDKYNDTDALLDYAFEVGRLYTLGTDEMQNLLTRTELGKNYHLTEYAEEAFYLPKVQDTSALTLRFAGDTLPDGDIVTVPVSVCDADGLTVCNTLITVAKNTAKSAVPAEAPVAEDTAPAWLSLLPYAPFALGLLLLLLFLLRTRHLVKSGKS